MRSDEHVETAQVDPTPLSFDSPPVGLIRRELDGPAAVLTMQCRPHNLLGPNLLGAVVESLEWAQDCGARAVLLRSGLRNFSAGADLDIFEPGEPTFDRTAFLRVFRELPMPVVASVHGVCVGGGFELALAADLIIAAESAKLGAVEATVGLNPLSGAIQRISQRAGTARANEMAMLGRRYDARTLERWNIVNRVVPDERLEEASRALVLELAHGPTVAHASTKAIVAHVADHGLAETDEAMIELQLPLWSTADFRAGVESLRRDGPGAARFEGR
jgi:enoyl-CoA hydratase/carnithine racemase